jgi:hypothetical protein
MLDTVVHTCSPSTQEIKQEVHKFESVYITRPYLRKSKNKKNVMKAFNLVLDDINPRISILIYTYKVKQLFNVIPNIYTQIITYTKCLFYDLLNLLDA